MKNYNSMEDTPALPQPDMKFICKTLKEAFYFDREELATKSFPRLLRMYCGNLNYNALVNIRLMQYFYHRYYKYRRIMAACVKKTKIKRQRPLPILLLHPLLLLKINFYKYMYKYIEASNYKKYGINISPLAEIDRNLSGPFRGMGITAYAKIGKNVRIESWVEIAPDPEKGSSPVIGDNVCIHTGAVIVGGIQIGDSAVIGANSLILSSVLPNTTVVGVPARVVFKR